MIFIYDLYLDIFGVGTGTAFQIGHEDNTMILS